MLFVKFFVGKDYLRYVFSAAIFNLEPKFLCDLEYRFDVISLRQHSLPFMRIYRSELYPQLIM